MHNMQKWINCLTHNINRGIFIVASRAWKVDHTTFKVWLFSIRCIPCEVSGRPPGGGSPKISSTLWFDGGEHKIVSHFLKSLWTPDDAARLSSASEALGSGTLRVFGDFDLTPPFSSTLTEVLRTFNPLSLLIESSFWSLPLKAVIVKGVNLDPQMWGGPTLETINPLYDAWLQNHLAFHVIV